jgi:putative hydrolase of the HAD superfamily
MTIQAVFFDMGGTIETFSYTRELRLEATPGIQERLLSAGIALHLNNEQLYDLVVNGLDRYHRWSLHSLEEISPARVWGEYILAGYPVDPDRLASIAEDLMLFIETGYYHREMRPEMPAVLETIRQMGLKIGLISNVCSRGQVPMNLEQYGIRHYFDPVVLSSEYGRRKPDPAIFHYAARLANVPTSECVYVGDRISRDISGARRAGYCLAIQIQHNFKHGEDDEGPLPDVLIDQMTELIEILTKELNNRNDSKDHQGARSKQVGALLFDAGDILYYRPRKGQKLVKFLQGLGLSLTNASAADRKALEHQAYQGLIHQDQYHEAILRLYGVTQPEDIERGRQILLEEENDIRIFPGIRKTLNVLKKRGYMLGIITDTAQPVHVKLGWFEQAGFGELWDSIVSSKEMGFRKPDPGIYQAALRQLGVHSSDAVFVGHKATELDGARKVGMKTVAFNYEETAEADYYITRFAELLNLPFINQDGME